MNKLSVADLRQNYTRAGLTETEAHLDPIPLFQVWLEQAIAAEILEPNGMTLATTNSSGYPVARMVLLKGFDPKGFVFHTNYNTTRYTSSLSLGRFSCSARDDRILARSS